MDSIRKSFALILILIMAISSLSLLMIKPAYAQTIPTPSVPEFTVKFLGTFSMPLTSNSLPSVNITIKNQPFTPFTDQHGNKFNLYYIIQWKENSSNSWQQTQIPLNESNTNYTTTNLGLIRSGAPPPSGQVDFQVEALIAYITYIQGSAPQGAYIPPSYTGEFGGWSNTQTITIPETSTSPTPTPTVPEFPTIMILTLFALTILLSIVLVRKIPKK